MSEAGDGLGELCGTAEVLSCLLGVVGAFGGDGGAVGEIAGGRGDTSTALQRAALLDVLADVPDVVLDGVRTDLAGRGGLAFRFAVRPHLFTVIIDQRTGEILAASSVLRFGDDVAQLTTLYLRRRPLAGHSPRTEVRHARPDQT